MAILRPCSKDDVSVVVSDGLLSGDAYSLFSKTGSIRIYGSRRTNVSIFFSFPEKVKITSIKLEGDADQNYYDDWWRQRTGMYLNGINSSNTSEGLIPYSRHGSINNTINVTNNVDEFYNKFELHLENWTDGGSSGNGDRNYTGITLYDKEKKIYLIKQDDQYYSAQNNTITLLGIPSDDTQKKSWFDTYGIDDLKTALLTSDSSGNKLIDKLNDKFEVKMMKLND